MGTIIKHGDFTFDDEKIQEIAKNIEVVNRKKAFWGQFCSPDATNVGDKLTLRRQILLDPSEIKTLNEGETPKLDQIKVATFDETTNSYGSYIKYSRQAYKKNRDSILEMARNQLAHNRLYDVESVRSAAFIGTTYTASKSGSQTYWDLLLNVGVRLRKNGAKPFVDGKYALITTPEGAAAIATEAKTAGTVLAGTTAGEELAKNGYIGDWGGFHIYSCSDTCMYSGESDANSVFLFVGLTEEGKKPVISRFADEGNVEVISHEIGSAGADDPTNEYGTIAARIDDIGAFLEHPECCIKATIALTAVAKDVPAAYDVGGNGQTYAK